MANKNISEFQFEQLSPMMSFGVVASLMKNISNMEHFQQAHGKYVDKCVEAMMFYLMHVQGLDHIFGKRYYETVGETFDWDNAKDICCNHTQYKYAQVTGIPSERIFLGVERGYSEEWFKNQVSNFYGVSIREMQEHKEEALVRMYDLGMDNMPYVYSIDIPSKKFMYHRY